MKFVATKLAGAFILEKELIRDARGYFAREFCIREVEARGLKSRIAQTSVAWNDKAGTLRGMHFQVAPHTEVKFVRCTAGAVYDVIIDLRRNSDTFGAWIGVELSAQNERTLYVPDGFAHGYQTLTDGAELHYMMTEFYAPGSARGLRYSSPAFGIQWPLPVSIISDADANSPLFNPEEHYT